MFTAIMRKTNGRVDKVQNQFSTLAAAQAFVDSRFMDYPNAFAVATPPGNVVDWMISPDNTISILPVGRTKEEVRGKRNDLVADADWTQLPDAPLTVAQKAAWVIYRQLLRDVTKQAGFPASVTWPPVPV